MHLLTDRGLNEAFLEVVDRHRREGFGVVVRRDNHPTRVAAEDLGPEVNAARQRIAELDADIAKYRRTFLLNRAQQMQDRINKVGRIKQDSHSPSESRCRLSRLNL
jgi:hypothetical protein